MIRIILRGRTGNILFQYAFGRYLAAKHDVPLVLDASWYNREGWGEVSHFLKKPLKAKVVRRCSLAARALRKWTRKHYWQFAGFPMVTEPADDQSFRKKFMDAPSNALVFGYFQTPLYFGDLSDVLRDEIRNLISTGAQQEELRRPDAVAVHVRRGDFLKIPVFRVCDEAYYRKSMDEMRTKVPGARFHIFSDDPEWCERTFREADTRIFLSEKTSKNPLHDLYAMSQASHHIISNSSYSWWAAWLASHPHQQVIMPGKWYAERIVAPMSEKGWDGISS